MFTVKVTTEEMEYLMMGLHHFLKDNAENAQTHGAVMISNTQGDDVEVDLVQSLWAPQNVEAQKLLDKLIDIVGWDLAIEGG